MKNKQPLIIACAVIVCLFFILSPSIGHYLPLDTEESDVTTSNGSGFLTILVAVVLFAIIVSFLSKKKGGKSKLSVPSLGISLSSVVSAVVLAFIIFITIVTVKAYRNRETQLQAYAKETGKIIASTPAPIPSPAVVQPGTDLHWGSNTLIPNKRYYFDRNVVHYILSETPSDYGSIIHNYKENHESTVYWNSVILGFHITKKDVETNHDDGSHARDDRFYFLVDKQMVVLISGTP